MKLVSGFWEARAAARERRAYDRMLTHPSHCLATVLLCRALELKADAICFGFRPDIQEDPEVLEARRRSTDQFAAWSAEQRAMYPSAVALDRSARTRGPAGEFGLPISMRVDGTLRYFGPLTYPLYGNLLQAIQARSVSLGASPEAPQPMRYIEIGYSKTHHPNFRGPNGNRRFVEVETEYAPDNTFWVYVHGVREVGAGVKVSQSLF